MPDAAASFPRTRARPSWSRLFGIVLFALTLGSLTFGPVLDSLVCHAEALHETAAHAAQAAADPGTDPDGDHHPAGEACVHGHCHHAALSAAPLPGVAVKPDLSLARAPVRPETFAPFDLLYGLERPPRD